MRLTNLLGPLPTRRHGSVLIVVTLFLPVLLAFTVATVDVGYMQAQRSRLQAVADAAVLSALGNVAWDGVDSATEQTDITNRINQVLTANGMSAGAFGTPTFTVDANDNVASVVLRGTVPAQTFFWSFIQPNSPTLDLGIETAAGVTYDRPWVPITGNWGIYGRDRVYGNGAFKSGAYNRSQDLTTVFDVNGGIAVIPNSFSTDPSYPEEGIEVGSGGTIDLGGIQVVNGSVTANGDITLGNNVTVWESNDNTGLEMQFDPIVIPGTNDNAGMTVTKTQGANVINKPVSDVLDADGNFNIAANYTVTLQPGGTYVFTSMDMNAQANLIVADWPAGTAEADKTPTKIFVDGGDMGINGNFYSNEQLEVKVKNDPLDKKTITCNGNAAMYMDLFAPDSNVKITGAGALFGRIVGWDVWCNGNADFFFDKDLAALPGKMADPPQVIVPVHLIQP